MATIEENEKTWNKDYMWSDGGNEWSIPWGGADMQWHTMILPRIHRFVPLGNTLEIACGRGRWTEFLKNISASLIGIDLSKKNIEFCKVRFKNDKHLKFYQNDGKSLDMVKGNSIDFIFSCDSLVHVSPEVLEAYISQFDRILKSNGVIFIHHSNLNEYKNKLPKDADIHWRDLSADAKIVENLAKKYNLRCIGQEKTQWISKTKHFIDCFSTITKKNSNYERKNRVFKNKNFQKEIKNSFVLSRLYSQDEIQIGSLKDLLYVLSDSLSALNLSYKQIEKVINLPYRSKQAKALYRHIKKSNGKDLTPLLVDFLVKEDVKKVAIYGAGEIFLQLEEKLKQADIKILHVIDKKAQKKEFWQNGYKVKSKSSLLKLNPKIPIVIASFAFADEIVKDLKAYKKANNLKSEIYDLHRCLT